MNKYIIAILFSLASCFTACSQIGIIGVQSSSGTTLSTPSPLTLSVISSSQINASWPNVSNEINYELQRSTDNSTWTTINSPAADITSYNNTGLTASTTYYCG